MSFSCQRNSYLRELVTKVVSCTKVEKDGKEFYDVILKDTVLFPGGGGQPFDIGTVNGISVVSMRKENGQAVHVLKLPVKAGDDALVVVLWLRRFDHMQQHTGQHLITALAESMFRLRTTSWNLGKNESYIEVDSNIVNIYQVEQIEQNANEVIRNCCPVTVHYYEQGDEELSSVRTRHELPDDHGNLIRVVTIDGVDRTTCCGTHVKFTSELQAVKLLYADKGKRGKTNLYFIVGERLLKYVRTGVPREKALTRLLGCSPEEHEIHVRQLQNSLKMANKNAKTALRDVASLEAKIFNMKSEKPAVFTLHRKNADLDFISVFLNEAKAKETLFFLTIEDPKSGPHMVLSGPLELVETYAPQVCRALEGQGSHKDGKFQGKFRKVSNIPQAELIMKNDLCIDHIFQL